ncbi:hypothetical protein OAQ84_00510 [Bdellovibrionales bacterium]|nr:hypothetical protein [Bdellovibrionales bacterium]
MDSTKKTIELEELNLERAVETEKSNLIASIDINIIDFREMLLEAYKNCDLCGCAKEFYHVANFVELNMEEESYCPTCNIHSEKQTHKIQ